MAPVIEELRRAGCFDVRIVVTAQHRELLDQVLTLTGLTPDLDLDIMRKGQSLDGLAAEILTRFGAALDRFAPDRVLVHGDTLTTMMASLACHFRRIPIGHVEAGLRSGDILSPWPEEASRRITGVLADLHFAPTVRAADALISEGAAPAMVHITGNTAVDALLKTRSVIASTPSLVAAIDEVCTRYQGKRIISVTAHRRENFGEGMAGIARALRQLAARDDVAILYPLHPNPNVREAMQAALHDTENIALLEPLDYPQFVRLLERSELILTDSGGVQEEAPSHQSRITRSDRRRCSPLQPWHCCL